MRIKALSVNETTSWPFRVILECRRGRRRSQETKAFGIRKQWTVKVGSRRYICIKRMTFAGPILGEPQRLVRDVLSVKNVTHSTNQTA